VVLAAVRSEVGDDRIVGFRTITDDLRSPEDDGIGFAAGAQMVRRLLDTEEIDVLNTTIGDGGVSCARAILDYRFGEAPDVIPRPKWG
jgi:2,4-dienoyl-CoA reductase-like NADH-dependent reductase (Old Yellow Enzyme family)